MNKAIEVTRGSLIECTHSVHIAVVNSEGDLIYSLGNPKKVIYARSSVKPIQAIQVLETKADKRFNISNREISFMCSSHSGETYHVECTREILKKANISVDKLNCGIHVPGNSQIYKELIESKEPLTQEHNNCSGKHSGMLISAKNLNEDLDTYLDINHPVQQRILENISFVCDYNKEDIIIGIDGCGAPVHAMPLEKFAYGFSRLADSKKLGQKEEYVNKITSSMMKYPEMVAGRDRFCTALMRVCGDRIFGKAGAQGVYLVGDKNNKLGIAIKVDDGSGQATACATMEVLRQLKLINEKELKELEKFVNPKLLNARKDIIGEMRPNFKLNNLVNAEG
ncbi:asparaginase [Paraclostridium sordellii]|uniref:asparaginase n=1 Tax=Paraclostridium sordellii TaxID=1505 RepID=UPI0005E19805|nr:asparaginase [Paeniclostridium sordellii]CEQ14338.1 asparaginase-like protein [[Clostridium] sordellii] [Paeniclostridium sordellii]